MSPAVLFTTLLERIKSERINNVHFKILFIYFWRICFERNDTSATSLCILNFIATDNIKKTFFCIPDKQCVRDRNVTQVQTLAHSICYKNFRQNRIQMSTNQIIITHVSRSYKTIQSGSHMLNETRF